MFVNFDSVFNPTEEQKKKQMEFANSIIKNYLETYGECCGNCKHLGSFNAGHGWMQSVCSLTREWLNDDEETENRCDNYEFKGFITEW